MDKAATVGGPRKFYVELIKPSHYDDNGYVIQWWKTWVPSNSLSSVYGLMLDAMQRRVLGDDTDIVIEAYDETNSIIPVEQITRRFQANDNKGLVCLVGVQSNQFPRAVDIARQFRQTGISVAIGGFHVSGCLAMLPELPGDLVEAQNLGITLFAGEAEGRVDEILTDANEARLAPLYNFMSSLPSLQGQPTPFLPGKNIRRYAGYVGCFDAGRGCPFTCSFCTIINVQGRVSRFRDADDVERLVRAGHAEGARSYFLTDDNFARNKNWDAIFDRLIHLREHEGIRTNFVVQVDTLCHRIPNFIEKAARAGCSKAFIGLENINPESLKTASKGQNRITEYRKMLQAWRAVKVITYCGYILGFPADTPESIERDIKIIQKELPVDILEFFCLTPLPGSADHKALYVEGAWMDPDMNKYDLEHVVTEHPLMSKQDWQGIYERAWRLYYSPDHVETLLKRAVASGLKPRKLSQMIFNFYGSQIYERVHPLQSGLFRRKVRTQRRYGFRRPSPVLFYPWRVWDWLRTYVPGILFYWRLVRTRNRIMNDPSSVRYTDVALTPVENENDEALELFQATDAAREAVANAKSRSKRIRRGQARASVHVRLSRVKQPKGTSKASHTT